MYFKTFVELVAFNGLESGGFYFETHSALFDPGPDRFWIRTKSASLVPQTLIVIIC